jgi:hypothetical protein
MKETPEKMMLSTINIRLKPITKRAVDAKYRALPCEPSPSVRFFPKRARYTGIIGKTQGERKERRPAKKELIIEILLFISYSL